MRRKTTVIDPSEPAFAGQAAYTPSLLRTYDTVVLGISNRWIWRCPTNQLVAHYEANVGPKHIDVGPGSGYFLDKASLPQMAELTLVDPNPTVLDHVARRVARLDPKTLEADALKPIGHPGGADSAGLNFVLHCIPGPFDEKAAAITNVAALLRPGGVLFGSTILNENHNVVGRRLMRLYNKKGIFGNTDDRVDDLQRVLADGLSDIEIELVGTVAIFRGTRPE